MYPAARKNFLRQGFDGQIMKINGCRRNSRGGVVCGEEETEVSKKSKVPDARRPS